MFGHVNMAFLGDPYRAADFEAGKKYAQEQGWLKFDRQFVTLTEQIRKQAVFTEDREPTVQFAQQIELFIDKHSGARPERPCRTGTRRAASACAEPELLRRPRIRHGLVVCGFQLGCGELFSDIDDRAAHLLSLDPQHSFDDCDALFGRQEF